jgi:hypothetical protein
MNEAIQILFTILMCIGLGSLSILILFIVFTLCIKMVKEIKKEFKE